MYSMEKINFYIRNKISDALGNIMKENNITNENNLNFEIEIPADSKHGDLSSNVALTLSKSFRMPPIKIAKLILQNLEFDPSLITKSEIAGPGFINFFLGNEFFKTTIQEIEKDDLNYGNSNFGNGKKIMVEFVSANPTGPMHMGNARLGALGDCLSSILKKVGYNVYKEFYVNDAGNQIEKFGLSLDVRYRQICNTEKNIEMPEECYQGQDITELAQKFYDIHKKNYIDKDYQTRKQALIDFALPKNINRMKQDMEKYKIIYDNWFYESKLHSDGSIQKIIDILSKNNYTYEKDGCLWYKSTAFGSD